MPNPNKKLIIIAGPTAVGKSSCSIELAKSIGGEIISADSMQVYKMMDIGTAKIRLDQMQGVRHYLIDVLDPKESFDVVSFKEMVSQALEEIYSHGNIPILVGGTGFYTQAILYDIDFTDSATDPKLREQLEADMDTLGEAHMFKLLSDIDPESAAAIPKENHKRVIRAIEYYQLTGNKISNHNKEQKMRPSPYDYHYFVLNDDRSRIYERINQRVDIMVKEGLVEEVKKLLDYGCDKNMTSMQGIGYKELIPYFEGNCSLDQAIEDIKSDTRHFAKRQITWYKREPEAKWIDISENDAVKYMNSVIKKDDESHE